MFCQYKEFRYQSFSQLKSDCIKADNLFNDAVFGADHLCLDIHGGMQGKNLDWYRPKDISVHPKLGVGIPIKGKYSSPAMAAALCAISTNQTVKDQIISKDQEWNSEKPGVYHGIFHFHFHYFGEWTDVVIDDRLPVSKNDTVYMGSENGSEFWASLIEKAYAKIHGGYDILNMIPVTDVLSDLTGGVSEVIDLKEFGSENTSAADEWTKLYEMMEDSDINNTIFIASTTGEATSEPKFSQENIMMNGLYAVAEIRKVNLGSMFNKEFVYLLKLISPVDELWAGSWSPGSTEWANLSDKNKQEMRLLSRRFFWMSIADFCTEFSHLIVNHVINTSMLTLSRTWKVQQFRSWWGDGRAGGYNCDRSIYIRCNHQFFFDVTDNEVIILMELTQKPTYTGAVSSINPFDDGKMPAFKSIGFTVVQIEVNREYRLHRTHYETVVASEFQCSRSVCLRTTFNPGRYCLIPSTYDTNVTGDFVLRIFSSKGVNLRHVTEEQPCRHWALKCFQKPYLAGVSVVVNKLEMIEGILDDPEALDSLAENELYCIVECEGQKCETTAKRGITWNESFTFYLTSPVTSKIECKVYRRQLIGSSMIGVSTLPLPDIFGSVAALDDTREKHFDLRLRDKNNLNLEIQIKMVASFFTDLMEI